MRNIKIRHVAVVVLLMLALLSFADGKPRPPGKAGDALSCFGDFGILETDNVGCDGTICYCCYDEGCWICNDEGEEGYSDCVWDPKYSSMNRPPTGPTSVSPGGGKVPVRRPSGTLLETEPININPDSGKIPIKQPDGGLQQTEPISISPESGQRLKSPGTSAQAGPTIINFDDLAAGGLGTGGPIPVTNQYASQGVTFNGPVAIDFSKGTAIPGFAHSGTNAIEQCYAAEFCTAPIEMRFSQGQSRVKVWVGYDSTLNEKTPVILRAFDSSGRQVAQDSDNLAEVGPIPIRIPLEVSIINKRNPTLTRSNIVRVTVDFEDENRFTNGLAVDDVEFERVEGILPDNMPELVKDSGEGQQYSQDGGQGQQIKSNDLQRSRKRIANKVG